MHKIERAVESKVQTNLRSILNVNVAALAQWI